MTSARFRATCAIQAPPRIVDNAADLDTPRGEVHHEEDVVADKTHERQRLHDEAVGRHADDKCPTVTA